MQENAVFYGTCFFAWVYLWVHSNFLAEGIDGVFDFLYNSENFKFLFNPRRRLKMKKWIVMVAAVVLVALVGCGRGTSSLKMGQYKENDFEKIAFTDYFFCKSILSFKNISKKIYIFFKRRIRPQNP